MQHTTTALSNSDQTTLTEYTNLPNSLSNLRLIAIGLANVERLQPFTSQQLRDENCGDTCL